VRAAGRQAVPARCLNAPAPLRRRGG
jgi:hypothetical protein